MRIEAFFENAMNARMALSALRRLGVEPDEPTPVPANNGRPWMLLIDFDRGSLSTQRYPNATLVNRIYQVVRQHNGTTEQVDRV